MSILLAQDTFESATLRYLDFGGLLRPTQGAPDQRLNRLGNRFGVDVLVGDVDSSSAEGRLLRQQLLQAKHQGAIFKLPQDGLDTGTPGSPRVNGASQSGSTLVMDGFTAGYNAFIAQPFSVIVGGRRYVYTVNDGGTANGSGQLALSITPMLRLPPSDNAVCEFATPYIEGNIVSDISWIYTPGNWQGLSFTIEEAA